MNSILQIVLVIIVVSYLMKMMNNNCKDKKNIEKFGACYMYGAHGKSSVVDYCPVTRWRGAPAKCGSGMFGKKYGSIDVYGRPYGNTGGVTFVKEAGYSGNNFARAYGPGKIQVNTSGGRNRGLYCNGWGCSEAKCREALRTNNHGWDVSQYFP